MQRGLQIYARSMNIYEIHNNASPRKRYEVAEAEYVASKLDMAKKHDLKTSLTEHLLLVIQQVHYLLLFPL